MGAQGSPESHSLVGHQQINAGSSLVVRELCFSVVESRNVTTEPGTIHQGNWTSNKHSERAYIGQLEVFTHSWSDCPKAQEA